METNLKFMMSRSLSNPLNLRLYLIANMEQKEEKRIAIRGLYSISGLVDPEVLEKFGEDLANIAAGVKNEEETSNIINEYREHLDLIMSNGKHLQFKSAAAPNARRKSHHKNQFHDRQQSQQSPTQQFYPQQFYYEFRHQNTKEIWSSN